MNFKFALGQAVAIHCSGESGHVIGRAEYQFCEASYQIRYKCADGRAVEAWWPESALTNCNQCEQPVSTKSPVVSVTIAKYDQVSEAIKDLVHRTIVESKNNVS